MKYNFKFNEKEYTLEEENLDEFFNDEQNPLIGLELEDILTLLNASDEVSFRREYFGSCCPKCKFEKGETKAFRFLEYYFYAYAKNNTYVISSISKEYENTNYTKLNSIGKVDNSYIIRIFVCENCGLYTIEIEEFEI
ncbi:MAG: DUF3785 family protein [Clostridium sp.]